MFMDSDVHGGNGLETNKHITGFPHPMHPVGHPSCSPHGQNMAPISSPRFDAATGKPHQPPSFVDHGDDAIQTQLILVLVSLSFPHIQVDRTSNYFVSCSLYSHFSILILNHFDI